MDAKTVCLELSRENNPLESFYPRDLRRHIQSLHLMPNEVIYAKVNWERSEQSSDTWAWAKHLEEHRPMGAIR
jgi:hypothetical protein